LAGVPAVSVPWGFTRSGLPIGLQIMAGVSSEPILLRIARILERSRPQNFRPPLPDEFRGRNLRWMFYYASVANAPRVFIIHLPIRYPASP